MVKDIHSSDPSVEVNDKGEPVKYTYDWIKHGQQVTMLLTDHWSTPKQGFLYHGASANSWHFAKGRKLDGWDSAC